MNIDLNDLVKFAWRRRAEYIIIGEVRGEEVQVLVQAAASGHGGLTTFHADNVESMILRLTSPPLNVKQSFLSLIWSIAVMRKLRIATTGRVVRRLTDIYEIVVNGDRVEKIKIFSWDPKTDTHRPDDVDEVLERSYRLKVIAERYGLSESDICRELKERQSFLEKLVEDEAFDYEVVSERLFKFYYQRRGIM